MSRLTSIDGHLGTLSAAPIQKAQHNIEDLLDEATLSRIKSVQNEKKTLRLEASGSFAIIKIARVQFWILNGTRRS
eukprot:6724702-Karenia_brevis.AAC.1